MKYHRYSLIRTRRPSVGRILWRCFVKACKAVCIIISLALVFLSMGAMG